MYILVYVNTAYVLYLSLLHLKAACISVPAFFALQMSAYTPTQHTNHSCTSNKNQCNIQEEKSASNDPSIPIGLVSGGVIDWQSKFKAYSLSTQPKRQSAGKSSAVVPGRST